MKLFLGKLVQGSVGGDLISFFWHNTVGKGDLDHVCIFVSVCVRQIMTAT